MSSSGGSSGGSVDTSKLVSVATAQGFTEAQKAIGLNNIGAVRVVEPEQFAGATDDAQMTNAINATLLTGGVIRLRPGKVYNWAAGIGPFDFSTNSLPLFIEAWGATINADLAGASATFIKSTTGASVRTLTVLGGLWSNALGDFFQLNDMTDALFFYAKGHTPAGSFVRQSNVNHFSERNSFVGVEDYTTGGADTACQHLFTFEWIGGTASMARTLLRDIKLQGGTTGNAKINISDTGGGGIPSLYAGLWNGISGNLNGGAIAMRLSGNMNNTVICGNIAVENSTGSGTAAVFTIGTMSTAHLPALDAPALNIGTGMALVDAGSTQPALYGAIEILPGTLGVGATSSYQIPNASPVALTANTETTVFTINVVPGEYILEAGLSIHGGAGSTAGNAQCRVNGGTATYTASGQSSAQSSWASNATIANQTCFLPLNAYLVVTVAGTVVVTARTSTAGQVDSTTDTSGYSHSSGYLLEQVA